MNTISCHILVEMNKLPQLCLPTKCSPAFLQLFLLKICKTQISFMILVKYNRFYILGQKSYKASPLLSSGPSLTGCGDFQF